MSTNLSKIKRNKMLETISKIKENIDDDETLKNLKEAFRLIFRSNLLLKDAVEKVTNELGHDENVKIMLEFINKSERGIAR